MLNEERDKGINIHYSIELYFYFYTEVRGRYQSSWAELGVLLLINDLEEICFGVFIILVILLIWKFVKIITFVCIWTLEGLGLI